MSDSVPPDINRWDNLSLADLAHLNEYAKNRMVTHGYTIPFHALSDRWVDTISPGVPDGRYVPLN